MIAPFPIVDHFIRLAVTMGVDVSPPVLFHFKDSSDSWIEFSFHEQLELSVRLCEVYNRRKSPNAPSEQRNVSVALGSHPRAGGSSLLRRLDPLLLQEIGTRSKPPLPAYRPWDLWTPTHNN